jgi:hypothetical protein
MGSSEDVNVVSELLDEVQAATVDCQVSSEARSLSGIRVTDDYSLLHPHPAYLVNLLPLRQGPVSAAKN